MQYPNEDTVAITLKRGHEDQFDFGHPHMAIMRTFPGVHGGVVILCSSDRPGALRSYLDSCGAVAEYVDSAGLHRKKDRTFWRKLVGASTAAG